MADEQMIRAALIADGYDPPPHVGQRWVDPDGTAWTPPGHREAVTITAIGKTITGWQLRVRRHLVNDAGEDVASGDGVGLMFLDHVLTGYRGLFTPYQPLELAESRED